MSVEGLTPAEISQWLPKFEKLSHSYAKHWRRRRWDIVDLEHLQSIVYEQAWRSLTTWRPNLGSEIIPHVKRGMWHCAKGESTTVGVKWMKRQKQETAWPQTEHGDEVIAAPPDLTIERSEKIAAGQVLMEVMREVLTPETSGAIIRVFLNDEHPRKVAQDLGVSHKGMRRRIMLGLKLLQRTAAERGILMTFNKLIPPAPPAPAGPKYRRVRNRKELFDFKWVPNTQ